METVSETAPDASVPVSEATPQIDEAAELRQMLDEMEARSGPIPPEVRARVRALPWPDQSWIV